MHARMQPTIHPTNELQGNEIDQVRALLIILAEIAFCMNV
jgi:hypothetical protein